MLKFFKYQGTGNDFVMIDDRDGLVNLSEEQVAFICSRRFGVGSDGLIILRNDEEYDFKMVYYNADGREGSMCGNGGRCTVKFASDLGIFEKSTTFIAVDGPHDAEVIGDTIKLKMSDTGKMSERNGDHFYDTGSPHVVIYQEQLDELDVKKVGAEIRYNEYWTQAGGTNVNFVELLSPDEIKVRTYERGVEDETYSCGTGVTACALDAGTLKGLKSPVKIQTKGGQLSVSFTQKDDETFTDLWLEGPAKSVFKGEIAL
ncbi:diaminopimelate epimerase [Jiulongibacter sp. NS-SX5]|uniref:diaminopimelate epimerase n=1 Tax=Jiulongibacter sp. NS-SX5 TaxID=3463854 RepID=UPI00405844CC